MNENEIDLASILKGGMKQIWGDETLFLEAIRELIKDEIKEHLKRKIESDPQLKLELKRGFMMYYEGKLREMLGGVIMAKAGTKLAASSIPDEIKDELTEELQKELIKLVDETL